MKTIYFTLFILITSNVFAQNCSSCKELYEQKKYTEVINAIATMTDSATIDDLLLLANSYQHLDLKKDAINAYSKLLLDNPDHFEALVAVSALFISTEQYKNADFVLEKASKINPKNTNILYNKLVSYYYQDKEKEMNSLLNEISLQSEAELKYLKAQLLLINNVSKEALSYFETLDKKEYEITFFSAYAYFKQNENEKAKTLINEALEMKEHEVDCHYYLAQIYKKENKLQEACKELNLAIEAGDMSIAKDSQKFCNSLNPKKFKLFDRGVRASF